MSGEWWALGVGMLVLGIWARLWLFHAGFWRIEQEAVPPPPPGWSSVTAVVPARNEEAVIGETLRSLRAQAYPEPFRVIVVDDHSTDRTRAAASGADTADAYLEVLSSEPLPAGWTGKVWAMQQGLARALAASPPPDFILFSDADISHGEGALRELVSRAQAGPCDLVSFMVRLECRTQAERSMIPAFVLFFRMLYPFRRANDPRHSLAAAAGGTMLVRREALERIGGLACIRGELIDDCSLAREIKRGGHRIWLGLSDASRSTRGYGTLSEILRMIARTAYTQLGCSPAALAGCVLGLALTFLAPPLLALFAGGGAALLGGAAWLLMTLLYLPMVRFYRQSPLWAPLLPVTAVLYVWATLLSAWAHTRGRGGGWKGRTVRARQGAVAASREEQRRRGGRLGADHEPLEYDCPAVQGKRR